MEEDGLLFDYFSSLRLLVRSNPPVIIEFISIRCEV